MADPIIKYIGNGNDYHPYIPARDLSASDYDALDTDQRATVRASAVFDYSSFRDAVKVAQARADAKAAKADAKPVDAPAVDATASAPVQKPAPTA